MNIHYTSESSTIRAGQELIPVLGGSTAPFKLFHSENLVHISYPPARICMKFSTHIDLIEFNIYQTASYMVCPTESQLFRVL